MRNSKTRGLVKWFLLGIALISAPLAASPDQASRQQAAEKAILELERQGYAGSVLVAQDGNIEFFRDSVLEKDASCIPSYWIASITKQFVAAGILLLQERNKLDIRNSIADYLPDVPDEFSGITLFHLLTHTSGLRQRYAADGIFDRKSAQQSLLAASLQSKPGETFAYANDNYNLLAIILEIQSGVPYEEFLRTEIFAPASMKNSGFWGMPVEAISCVPEVAAAPGQSVSGSNWGFRGATGMRASVHDLFAFVQTLRGEEILSRESVDMLMGNHLQLASGTEIGFNWFGERNENGLYSKSSRGNESFGANAVIYIYPHQDLIIITATNAGPAETGDGPVEGWSRKTHAALAAIFVEK